MPEDKTTSTPERDEKLVSALLSWWYSLTDEERMLTGVGHNIPDTYISTLRIEE